MRPTRQRGHIVTFAVKRTDWATKTDVATMLDNSVLPIHILSHEVIDDSNAYKIGIDNSAELPLSQDRARELMDDNGTISTIIVVDQRDFRTAIAEETKQALNVTGCDYYPNPEEMCHDIIFDFGHPDNATASIIGVMGEGDTPDLIVRYTTNIASQFDDNTDDGTTYRSSDGSLLSYPLTHIIYLTGDEYDNANIEIDKRGGSTRDAISYFQQWDYGDDTDKEAEVNGFTDQEWVEFQPCHIIDYGGITYWLIADHTRGYYSLYRKPLSIS